MAIIFDISKAIASSEFNILGLSIPMLISNEVEQFEKGSKIGSLFTFRKLSTYSTSVHTSIGHGGFQPTEEMETAPLHDWEDSYGKTFVAQTWMDGFAVTKQAMEDNQDLDINTKTLEFANNYNRTRESYAAAVAAGALLPGFTYGNKKFSALAIDTNDAEIDGANQIYFNKNHYTSVKVADAAAFKNQNGYDAWTVPADAPAGLTTGKIYATKPQSNKFLITGGGDTTGDTAGINMLKVNPALGNTAANIPVYDQLKFLLFKIKEIGQNHKDLDGKKVPLNYSRIIIPANAFLEKTLRAALGDNVTTGPTTAPLPADKFEIVTWAYLNDYDGFGENELGMIITDPDRNSRNLGFSFWDRLPLTVRSYIQENNQNMVWEGRARFKADTSDPYAAVYLALGSLKNLSAAAYSGSTVDYANDTGIKNTTAHTIVPASSNASFIDLTTFTVSDAPTIYDADITTP